MPDLDVHEETPFNIVLAGFLAIDSCKFTALGFSRMTVMGAVRHAAVLR